MDRHRSVLAMDASRLIEQPGEDLRIGVPGSPARVAIEAAVGHEAASGLSLVCPAAHGRLFGRLPCSPLVPRRAVHVMRM